MKRQFIPIPDNLTALIEFEDDHEHYLYDAVSNGECVFYVMNDNDEDEDSTTYCQDCRGTLLFDPVWIVPTMYCCGNRMTVNQIPLNKDTHLPSIYTGEVIYHCSHCGLEYSKENGWR